MEQNIYPIIFVPGILGTAQSGHHRLEYQAACNPALDKMTTDHDPVMPDDDGGCDRQIDRPAYQNKVISLLYGEMIAELRESLPLDREGYARTYVFPYDWRHSISHNAAKLADFVELIISKSNAHTIYQRRGLKVDKVNIVGHSMGGCLAKHYATVLLGESRINRLVMLASPLRGSLYALKHLIMGEAWFFDWFTRKGKRRVARTLPGVYDLLPYDGFGNPEESLLWPSPAVERKGEPVNIFDPSRWQDNVAAQIGPEALARHLGNSYSYYRNARDFSPEFQKNVLMVYGKGERTLRSVNVGSRNPVDYNFPRDDRCDPIGDGVVPAVSTYCEGIYQVCVTKKKLGDWELDLGKIAGFHASFCAYDLIQDLVISFLTGRVIKTVRTEFKLTDIEQLPKFTIDQVDKLDREPIYRF
ncbi:MAG: alpha/beta hydrolase [Candidatus Edwardsbacteria bacterium]|nr:alpha/beta hydrolase [Candidatus Edwardsbacteria bacterium]MBU1576781.1 alpha/beta hydrolase [Candidatus Edwardsbacteria bacterium]MBU2464580.1 alpha/beta hydrolase [Candidatus Edwardsbacteria bacterium]MBU2593362.1 alpha/beta hydrolase [Candidatus Edwardsbacteria bacterium]